MMPNLGRVLISYGSAEVAALKHTEILFYSKLYILRFHSALERPQVHPNLD